MKKLKIYFYIFLLSCSHHRPKVLEKLYSPSGKYVLSVEKGNTDIREDHTILWFKLSETQGKILDSVRTGASTVQKWTVNWHNDSVIVLASKDIGTLAWLIKKDNKLIPLQPSAKILDYAELTFTNKYGGK